MNSTYPLCNLSFSQTHTHTRSISILLIQTHVLAVPAGQIRRRDSLLERKWHEQDRKQRRHHIHSQVHFCSMQSVHTHTQNSSRDTDVSSVTSLTHRHTQSWTSEISAICASTKYAECPYDTFPLYEAFKLLMFESCLQTPSSPPFFSRANSHQLSQNSPHSIN